MKKHLISFITGILLSSLIIFVFQIFIMKSWEREDVSLLLQLITGIAPFVAAFSAYYMWIKNRDYKNEYYKKILDRRLDAYERIYILLASFRKFKYYTANNTSKSRYFMWYDDNEKIKQIKIHIENVIKCSQWISPYVYLLLVKLFETIDHLSIDITAASNKSEKISLAIDFTEALLKEAREIRIKIDDDLLSMYDIKAFLEADKKAWS